MPIYPDNLWFTIFVCEINLLFGVKDMLFIIDKLRVILNYHQYTLSQLRWRDQKFNILIN